MDELLATHWPALIGLYFLARYAVQVWQEQLTSVWPTTPARLIEIPASGLVQRSGNRLRRRRGGETDFALEYRVLGVDYITRIRDYSSVTSNGRKLESSSGLPPEFALRYNANNPTDVYYQHLYPRQNSVIQKHLPLIFAGLALTYYVYSLMSRG